MRMETPAAGQTQTLAEIYAKHHDTGARLGFTFGGDLKGTTFARWIGTGKRILDVGCRDGTLTRYYAPGNEVVGVDVDREALARCAAALAIETHWLDIMAGLPFESASFDVVVCSEVMEHLPWPDRAMAEIARVLRPGGVFVGSVPNAFRLKNRALFLAGVEYERDPTHLRRFSPRGLRSLLGRWFTGVEVRPVVGRLARLSPALFGNTLLWRCDRP